MKTEGSGGPVQSAPISTIAQSQKSVSLMDIIDAEFANEVLEIRAEMMNLQQKIEAIEPGFNPEMWLQERGL